MQSFEIEPLSGENITSFAKKLVDTFKKKRNENTDKRVIVYGVFNGTHLQCDNHLIKPSDIVDTFGKERQRLEARNQS